MFVNFYINDMMRNIYYLIITVFLSYSCAQDNTFKTDSMILKIDESGHIKELVERKTGQDFLYKNESASLLSIRVQGVIESPSQMSRNTDNTLDLYYANSKVNVKVKYAANNDYISFEVTDVVPRDNVDLIIWGPYPTTIKKMVGETVGVVRNEDYALGIQALNIKTLGGYPANEDDTEPAYDIFATSDLIDVSDSIKVFYRGQTARPTSFGSLLQAYCRDRSKPRVIPVWNHEKYQVPAFEDGGVIGSKIALFGCSPDDALATIGKIEVAEGLPHPVIDGVWGKINPEASASYLIMSFGEKNLDDAMALTKKAGLKYLYHGGPFENWGHFKLNEREFPDNWESMKRCVERAKAQGLRLGLHTLSNFITTNDPYVTPVPDPRLAKVGSSKLTTDIDEFSKEIAIEDPTFFNQMKNNNLHSVVVGEEIIRYADVTAGSPWKLTDCTRGAFGTRATAHHKGDVISKLMDHGYKTFLGNMQLSEEMARRIADLYNETGLRQVSFDGLEGNWASGMGQYGRQLFVKTWYDHLDPQLHGKVINDASNPGHFFWHIYTRMNWGEPWYAGFRESQTQYRLLNQDYFRRNLMPGMLGWFSMKPQTSLEDIEWLLARAAGFDAGFALVTSPEIARQNGLGDELLTSIKQWETARLSGAFSEEQKGRLQKIKNEFSLEPLAEYQWKLYQYEVLRFSHAYQEKQPGEPSFSTFEFENQFQAQPLNFIFTANENTIARNIILEMDNHSTIHIDVAMQPEEVLKYNGGDQAILYDKNWHIIRHINMDPTKWMISEGNHVIQFSCDFNGHKESSLKIELRMKNAGEVVSSSRNH